MTCATSYCGRNRQSVLLNQGLPDVTEVEVNGEGLWRPNGTNMPWCSTITDTGPLTMSAINIKPDPEHTPDSEPLLGCHPRTVPVPASHCTAMTASMRLITTTTASMHSATHSFCCYLSFC